MKVLLSAHETEQKCQRCLELFPGVAGDGTHQQGGSQGRPQGGSAPHHKGHHHMYEFANHPADEAADEFGSRKSLFLRGRAGHPAPRQ